MSANRLVALLSLFCGFIASICFALGNAFSFAAGSHDSDNTIEVPEYYFSAEARPQCILRVQLSPGEKSYRKDILLTFIRRSYEKTNHWQEKFAVGGVDYVSFQYLYVISYRDCNATKSTEIDLRSDFPFGSISRFDVVKNTPLVSSLNDLRIFGSPISEFMALRSAKAVERCLVSLKLNDPRGFGGPSKGYATMVRTWEKYRIPIFDISWRDRDVFVLFGRQCDSKKALYATFLNLASYEGSNLRSDLGPPDFQPDLATYLKIASASRYEKSNSLLSAMEALGLPPPSRGH